MRHFHIFFNRGKNWHQIVCSFLCFYQFLHDVIIILNIVLQIKTKQFYDHILQKLVKTGKNTKINKQSDVKFWLKWNLELSHIYQAVMVKSTVEILQNFMAFSKCMNFTVKYVCTVQKMLNDKTKTYYWLATLTVPHKILMSGKELIQCWSLTNIIINKRTLS